MRIRIAIALLLLSVAFCAVATGSRADVSKTIESSMLVTGTIDIETDGSVGGYQLDQPEKLPEAVRTLMARALPQWRFEPIEVDGRVVKARSKMGVRVIARQLADGNYQLRVGGASFGEGRRPAERADTTVVRMDPPHYPVEAARSNVTGTVYLLAKVDPQGDVVDAVAEQVNLTVLGNEKQMARGRKLLATPSVDVAKRNWKFRPPTPEQLGEKGFYVVRIPISYMLDGMRTAGYGEWTAYIPGPRERPEWAPEEDDDQSPDAMIAGEAYGIGQGPRLLTPLSES